jgi:hypothetical protein
MPGDGELQKNDMRALEWLLRLVCAVMFLGHGWMAYNGQMPLRALLWDEALVAGAVENLTGMNWDTWVSSMRVDAGIDAAIRIQAWVYLLLCGAALLPVRNRWFGLVYLAGALDLAFLAWLKFHDVGMGLGQLFEQASQVCLPIVLFLVVRNKPWALLAKLGLAATFIGHGLFALDFSAQTSWLNHQRPGHFVEMIMLCLKLEAETDAVRLLVIAGIADFIAAGMIFLRGWLRVVGLVYMFAWGLLTALARPWAYFEPTAATETLLRWIPEMLCRAPHFGLPLCLLLALWLRRAEV